MSSPVDGNSTEAQACGSGRCTGQQAVAVAHCLLSGVAILLPCTVPSGVLGHGCGPEDQVEAVWRHQAEPLLHFSNSFFTFFSFP